MEKLKENLKKEDLIWVQHDDDTAGGIFDSEGNLKMVLDVYHGEDGYVLQKFGDAIGVKIHDVYAGTLLGRELSFEELNVDATNEIPLLEEISKAISTL